MSTLYLLVINKAFVIIILNFGSSSYPAQLLHLEGHKNPNSSCGDCFPVFLVSKKISINKSDTSKTHILKCVKFFISSAL